jgi:hypothetical protein
MSGGALRAWRAAMQQWRETGDVSGLAEVAVETEPRWRRMLLDAIVATSLRNDVEGLLRTREQRCPVLAAEHGCSPQRRGCISHS